VERPGFPPGRSFFSGTGYVNVNVDDHVNGYVNVAVAVNVDDNV
jgi:hypothetical protein